MFVCVEVIDVNELTEDMEVYVYPSDGTAKGFEVSQY